MEVTPKRCEGMNLSWNLNLLSGPKFSITCGNCSGDFESRLPRHDFPGVICPGCHAINRIPLRYVSEIAERAEREKQREAVAANSPYYKLDKKGNPKGFIGQMQLTEAGANSTALNWRRKCNDTNPRRESARRKERENDGNDDDKPST